MPIRVFDLGPCVCLVDAPLPVHDKLGHYLDPYRRHPANPSDPGQPLERGATMTLTVAVDPVAVKTRHRAIADQPPDAVRASHPEQWYLVWSLRDGEILNPFSSTSGQSQRPRSPSHIINVQAGNVTLIADTVSTAATVANRIARQALIRSAEVRGGMSVHAATVEIDGHGVLLAGHPGAGKTSTFTNLIEHHGARPISNDRTLIIPTDGGSRYRAVGVPLAARYTPEGIVGSPILSSAWSRIEPARGRSKVDGKVEMTPRELAAAFGRATVPAVDVTHLAILTRTAAQDSSVPPHLDQPDTAFVRDHLGFGDADVFAEDWLGLTPHLTSSLPAETLVRPDDLWAHLANTVPIQVLSWSIPADLPRLASATRIAAASASTTDAARRDANETADHMNDQQPGTRL